MIQILHGDCLDLLPGLSGIDACICDPPYGLKFMGKGWDHGVPGVPYWRAVLAACKPGAHLLAFGGTRTFHRLACAIEDAGWEIRDTLGWLYGSGFPKSHDVSKGIDREAGAEREVVGKSDRGTGAQPHKLNNHETGDTGIGYMDGSGKVFDMTAPATELAKVWQGWGTALKPAWEPIILARKPLDGTVAANVQKHGCGGLNIDGGRVAMADDDAAAFLEKRDSFAGTNGKCAPGFMTSPKDESKAREAAIKGRWPANVLHDGSEEVLVVFPNTDASKSNPRNNGEFQSVAKGRDLPHTTFGHDDNGGSASRFFYCAKASKQDRDEGCEGLEVAKQDPSRKEGNPGGDNPRNRGVHERTNHHPTVKPTSLMRYLCKLVAPTGGLILDPFMGSGSTGKAAVLEGFRFIGIDKEAEYVRIAEARIRAAIPQPTLL